MLQPLLFCLLLPAAALGMQRPYHSSTSLGGWTCTQGYYRTRPLAGTATCRRCRNVSQSDCMIGEQYVGCSPEQNAQCAQCPQLPPDSLYTLASSCEVCSFFLLSRRP